MYLKKGIFGKGKGHLHLLGIEPQFICLPIAQQEADINKLLVTSCTAVCAVV
jgi:hypothetical protein